MSWVISTRTMERGRELEVEFNFVVNDSVNHAYTMKLQEKLWTPGSGELPWLVIHIDVLGELQVNVMDSQG